MRRVPAVEGEPITELTLSEARDARVRLEALTAELRPRIKFLVAGVDLTVQNLVGSVQVTPELVLDIAPKTKPTVDWAGALVDLLTAPTRLSLGPETDRAERRHIRTLPDAFAAQFARQLERAVRREGPLTLMVPQAMSVPALAGRLDVTKWVTSRQLRPAHFPQHQTRLTADNPFTAAMSWVADLLSRKTTDARVSARLRAISGHLRPGLPPHVYVDPGVAARPLPPQWKAYGPAWATTQAVLRRLAPLHQNGAHDGFGLALEPWPLLETLTERIAKAIAGTATSAGWTDVEGHGHAGNYPLRTPVSPRSKTVPHLHTKGWVNPDAILTHNGSPLVTFEAKYSSPTQSKIRSHSFQALTTAAALQSPVSVLVYPTRFEPISWTVTGFHEHPSTLVAVGVDLYGYRHGSEHQLGRTLFEVLKPDF